MKRVAVILILAAIVVFNIIPLFNTTSLHAGRPRKWGDQYTNSKKKVICICDKEVSKCSPCDD